MRGADAKIVALAEPKVAKFCFTDTCSVRQYRLENGL